MNLKILLSDIGMADIYSKKEHIMGNKYTEAQKKATAKFMADKHTIRVVVTKSKADEYKAKADVLGKSLNQYIIDCIERG